MRRPKIFFVPAVLVILPATVLLSAPASLAEPTAIECRTKPGSTARPGTQWYYRVNPTNNQRCWFLGHEGLKARSRAREGASPMPAPNPTSKHENAEAARETPAQVTAAQIASPETAPLIAPAQGASAEVAFTEPSFGEDATAIDFAARWPDLDLNARGPEMMSNIYTEGQADTREQIPLMLSHSVGMVAFRTAFVANTLAISVLLAGAIFFARRRRSYRCDHWGPAVDRRLRRQMRTAETAARGSAVGLRRDRSVGQPPTPTDPAHDLKTSLRELMSDLQRAAAASGPLLSFAPPAR
jgi:hypothetical protein